MLYSLPLPFTDRKSWFHLPRINQSSLRPYSAALASSSDVLSTYTIRTAAATACGQSEPVQIGGFCPGGGGAPGCETCPLARAGGRLAHGSIAHNRQSRGARTFTALSPAHIIVTEPPLRPYPVFYAQRSVQGASRSPDRAHACEVQPPACAREQRDARRCAEARGGRARQGRGLAAMERERAERAGARLGIAAAEHGEHSLCGWTYIASVVDAVACAVCT